MSRILVLVLLLLGAFIFLTSNPEAVRRVWDRAGAPGKPLWTGGPGIGKAAGLSADEQNNIDIYEKAHSATVNITSVVYRQDWFFNVVPERGSGSGFLVDKDGRVLTNSHVTAGQAKLTVTLPDGSRFPARVLTQDPDNDLALIQIKTGKELPYLRLGESEGLRVGQKVLAIGNPFGFQGTLTTGIISSLGRSVRGDENTILEDMIQTDAAINPGNSGGPLLNSEGSVIGINTAIFGPGGNIGIGFAMPIDRAKVMLDEYSQKGYFSRPALGARTLFLPSEWAQALRLPAKPGLLVIQVERGSNAATAGLRGATQQVLLGQYEIPYGGDFILGIDGREIEDQSTMRRALARKRPGEELTMVLFREGRTLELKVKLDERRVGVPPEETL